MKSSKDSYNQHTQDMGVVTGRFAFRIFISGDWNHWITASIHEVFWKQAPGDSSEKAPSAIGSFWEFSAQTYEDWCLEEQWMNIAMDRSFHPAMGSLTRSFSQMVDPHGQNELQRFIRNVGPWHHAQMLKCWTIAKAHRIGKV